MAATGANQVKYLNAVRVGGVKDGSAVVLAGATENDGIFSIAIQTQEIGRVVCELLRILALPEFEAHAPAKPPMQVAGSQAARPFRVEAVSVAKAPLRIERDSLYSAYATAWDRNGQRSEGSHDRTHR